MKEQTKRNFETEIQFAEELANAINSSYAEGLLVTVTTVDKNNGVKQVALRVTFCNANYSPTLYVQSFFEDYKNDKNTFEEITEKVLNIILSSRLEKEPDMSFCTDYSIAKSMLRIAVCDEDSNEEILKDCPHYRIAEGLTAFCQLVLKGEKKMGIGTVRVRNQLLENWGVPLHVVYSDAILNTQLCARLDGMKEVFACLIGGESWSKDADPDGTYITDETDSFYVLSNSLKTFGAGSIASDFVMEKVAEKIGDGFYIIPSSVHEVLVLPNFGMPEEDIVQMIREVNEEMVDPKDVLSNNLYQYRLVDGVQLVRKGMPINN